VELNTLLRRFQIIDLEQARFVSREIILVFSILPLDDW